MTRSLVLRAERNPTAFHGACSQTAASTTRMRCFAYPDENTLSCLHSLSFAMKTCAAKNIFNGTDMGGILNKIHLGFASVKIDICSHSALYEYQLNLQRK